MADQPDCLACGSQMGAYSETFSLDFIIEQWRPITFSEEVVREHRQQAPETKLFVCSKCGLQAFFPQIIGTPRFYVEAYSLGSEQRQSEFTYTEEKWDFDEGLKDAQGCASVIEVGCGPGHFLARVKALVPKVYGAEYNEPAARRARAAGFEVFDEKNDLSALQGRLDAAFSFHVLEHVSNPLAFLEHVVDLVRPGGRIGISVPNQAGPIRFMDPCVMNMPPHHATRWDISSLAALAERVGLRIHRVAYEPLLLENHSYYSVYWVQHVLPGDSTGAHIFRNATSTLLRAAFRMLRIAGIRYFPWLQGLSIYLLLVKPETTVGNLR